MNQKQTIKKILLNEEVTSWFQPVIDLSGMRVSGWGALIRGPSTTPFHSASALLDGAEQVDMLKPLEMMCIKNAIICFEQLLLGGKLFMNISHEMLFAGNLLRNQLKTVIAKSPVSASKVVLELNIRNSPVDIKELKESIEFFHGLGFQFAIDNLGTGMWPDDEWPKLNADYVKIDRNIINGIDADEHKQAFLRNTVAIARASGIKIIAEGIETLAELAIVRNAGINLVQGYLFQRPELSPLYPDMGKLSEQIASTKPKAVGLACDLVMQKDTLTPETRLAEIKTLFEMNEQLDCIVVVDAQQIYGLLHKSEIGKPGLAADTPASTLVTSSFLSVDSLLPLDQVCHLVTTRPKASAKDDFIITHQGKFLGRTDVIELLRKMAYYQKIQ